MDIQLFKNLFKNKILSTMVFQYVKIIHQRLDVKRYNWYDLLKNTDNILIKKHYNEMFYDYFINNNTTLIYKPVIRTSIQFGNVNVLHDLTNIFGVQLDDHVPVSEMILEAAINCNLDVLQFINSSPWLVADVNEYDQILSMVPEFAKTGISTDYLPTVKWFSNVVGEMKSNYVPPLVGAAAIGDMKMVQWLAYNRPQDDAVGAALQAALNGGFLHIANWLEQNQFIKSNIVINLDLIESSVESMIWADHYCQTVCTAAAMNQALKNNNLKIIYWLVKHRNEGCSTEFKGLLDKLTSEWYKSTSNSIYLN